VAIMMTAYAVEDLIQDALQEGAFAVIYKPLDPEKMISLIEEARKSKNGALIMVVDDDPGTRTTLRNILTGKNYKVASADSGEQAIELAKEQTFDVFLIDMNLPSINGLETYLSIKEINSEAIAIMITGYRQEMNDLVEEALRNSAYTCLYKPLGMEKLLGVIDQILQIKQ
jgi:DNA-binding NtrC family response regulator